MIDIFMNPIVIALLTGTLTYLYVWWSNEDKYRKDPEAKKTSGIIIPLVVTVITWILAYGYVELTGVNMNGDVVNVAPNVVMGDKKIFDLVKDNVSSASAKEFHLIGRGVNIPNNLKLPDVFIETI